MEGGNMLSFCNITFFATFWLCIHVWLMCIVVGMNAGIPNVLPLQPVAIVNSRSFLFCFSNGDSWRIQWIKNIKTNEFIGTCDGSNIGYSVTCNSLYTESRLEIESVNATDLKSNWSCIAFYNDGTQRLSNTVTLYEQTLIGSITVMSSVGGVPMDTNDITTNSSDKLTLSCITSPAYPDPIINWYITRGVDASNGYNELEDTENIIGPRGSNGTIIVNSTLAYNVTREANGKQIHCKASNHYSSKSSPSMILNVQYSANITTFTLNTVKSDDDTNVDIIRGSSMSYRCEVDSNPPARITLSRGATTLKVVESGTVLIHEKETTTSDDEGMYTCNARNPVFNSWTNEQIYVAIVYGAEITQFLINNERYESNVTLNEKGSLSMICTGDGKPNVNMYIESKNTKCQPTQSGYGVCEIHSMNCEDHAGLYTCFANNPFGNATRRIKVFVNCIPTITKNSKGYVTLIANETVTLTATITAYPVPYVFWTLPNSSISFGTCHKETETIYLSIQVCSLTVKTTNGHEYGTYKLTAYNMRGSKSIDFAIVDPNGRSSFSDQQPAPVNIGLIVGPVAGGLVIIAIIAVVVYFSRKRSSFDKGSSTERTLEGVYEESSMQDVTDDSHQYASLSSSTEPVPRQPQPKPEDLTYINLELKQS